MILPKATIAALACVLLTNPITVASAASGKSASTTGAPLDDASCGAGAVSTVTVHDVKTVFVTGGHGVHNGAQAAFDAQATTATPSNNNGNSGKDDTRFVTVTKTIEHIKPVTKTVTSTKKNGKVFTTTAVATITSTEIRTVTAAPTPTTIISTTTLDQPVTVATTVTEEGKEVIKTTEVFTQVVTITSDVVQQTQISTTTDLGTGTTTSSAVSATESAQSSSNSTDVSGSGSSNSTSTDDDAQTSLTLDPREIMTSLFSDGNPSDGQTPALTSHNNFINYCLTQNVPITNGEQIKTGSCNPVPMGRVLSTDRLPSATFIFPPNFGSVKANTTFTIQMKIQNLVTGNFVSATDNYYAAPAQVDETGTLIGHSHIAVDKLDSFDQPEPTNPNNFAFFKGLNDAAVNGILSANVTGGLPPGKYRISSINSAANHQPCLASVAQHGPLDGYGYFSSI